MLINPFPSQNSKATPAGFCKQLAHKVEQIAIYAQSGAVSELYCPALHKNPLLLALSQLQIPL